MPFVAHTKNVNFNRTSFLASFANKFLPARKIFKSCSFVLVEICFLPTLPAQLAKEARNEVSYTEWNLSTMFILVHQFSG